MATANNIFEAKSIKEIRKCLSYKFHMFVLTLVSADDDKNQAKLNLAKLIKHTLKVNATQLTGILFIYYRAKAVDSNTISPFFDNMAIATFPKMYCISRNSGQGQKLLLEVDAIEDLDTVNEFMDALYESWNSYKLIRDYSTSQKQNEINARKVDLLFEKFKECHLQYLQDCKWRKTIEENMAQDNNDNDPESDY